MAMCFFSSVWTEKNTREVGVSTIKLNSSLSLQLFVTIIVIIIIIMIMPTTFLFVSIKALMSHQNRENVQM